MNEVRKCPWGETLDYKKPMDTYHNSLAINNQNYDDLGKKVG